VKTESKPHQDRPRRAAADRPNVVLIVADDLGYGDIGCDGGRFIRTPHIDRLAADGVRLTDFYASANVCTPSRAGLLTGRYAVRLGLAHEVIQPGDTSGLPGDELTIAGLLADTYDTALVGKWHLGHVAPHWPPTVHGFHYFAGLPYSHDMKPLWWSEVGAATSSPAEDIRDDTVDLARLTERSFLAALDFIDRDRERPFFVLLALTAPHIPLVPHPDEFADSPAGRYGDVVEEVDRWVGRLLAHLAARGRADNTLVAFTSDNGPWFEGSAGPFRDRKGGSAWDGGFRVPFVARWPRGLPAGQVRDGISVNLDLLPTLATLAGAELPAALELDGRDLTAMLRDDAPSPHDEIVLFDNRHVAGLRTPRWKLVVRSYYRTYDVALHRMPLLFDMQADPGETYNVADRYPDALADMLARLARARARFDPIAARFPPHVAPASAAAHPD
jgi:arylsulfatase A-like enzyme